MSKRLAAIVLFSLAGPPATAQERPDPRVVAELVGGAIEQQMLVTPGTWLLWEFSGPQDQCRGARGLQQAEFNEWMGTAELDMDDRGGGCSFRFAVVDTDQKLDPHLILQTELLANGNVCRPVDRLLIPISTDWMRFRWSPHVTLDTNHDPGGCEWQFHLSGLRDVALYVRFTDDGGDAGQCWLMEGHSRATHQVSARLYVDTDNRPGGCKFRIMLGDLPPP